MGTIYIVIASILWGLLHSIVASHGFKHLIRKLFGSQAFYRFYRLAYNLFALATFFPIILLLTAFPDRLLYSIPPPWMVVMIIAQAVAFFALIAGVMQTGPLEFAGLAQLSPAYGDMKPAGLVVDGLYAYVRHPLYTAGLVFIWLAPEMSVNRLVLWIVFSLYIIIGAYFEEQKLLKDFGSEYAEYKAKTPMLIPSLRKKG